MVGGYGVGKAELENHASQPGPRGLSRPREGAGGRRRHVVPAWALAGWRPTGTDQGEVPDKGASRAAPGAGPDPGFVVAITGVERARGPHRVVLRARPRP